MNIVSVGEKVSEGETGLFSLNVHSSAAAREGTSWISVSPHIKALQMQTQQNQNRRLNEEVVICKI